jgi:L-methionine (R)-S-oxide reductase
LTENISYSTDYKLLLTQIQAVCDGESNLIANLANITALIQSSFYFHWVGFYIVEGDELVLGPFQGPVACTRIPYGKGVCGASWESASTIIVPNVHEFPGHIACSSLSNSEIVIPVIKNGEVVMIMDVDSTELNKFDDSDKAGLESICAFISQL